MEQVLSPRDILKFTREKYIKEIRECKPFFTLFEITNRCNLNCKHSMLDCKYCGQDPKPWEGELSREEVYSLINNISRAGTTSLSFIGGEPTLREDLPQLVAYASRYMGVSIVTNGVLLDKRYVQMLKEAGITCIKVYLDSPEAKIHDSLRGKGTHRKVYQAIEDCRRVGVDISIIFTLTPLNYKLIQEMVRIALEMRAIIETTEFLPKGGQEELILTKGQRREAQRNLLEAQRLFGRQRVRFAKYYILDEDEEGVKVWADPSKKGSNIGYPWGIYGYGIKANGKMVADPLIPIELGDLRKQRLSEIWGNSVMLNNLRHRGKLKGKCGRCEYKFICGGHRGRTYALTGDFMEEDPACWYEPSLV
jgi:radical SAM protein with 4Fe4S-binding SPASM domain